MKSPLLLPFAPYTDSKLSKNPAVTNNVPQIFDYVLRALDAETIQGQTAERVVIATKSLLAMVGITPDQVLASMPVERHNAARRWFSNSSIPKPFGSS